ncbi:MULTISPECIES: hypothetical protein [unclassified Cryobacterium]|uniref:hypothetical protein n=1 Tax=unclassified Cryobacterium TaxID=2649013 RepID=UPI00106D3C11|nr:MULTISPECIES: hypothetical protein [unclassified Cryobacterium]TFC56508.1 hypothetical protein E3O60_17150 [Cryobacterium sp. TMB1-7]TFC59475.1 hypothetical protein E3O68_00825 [Cryobacterium sp. TMB3-1-2]TFC67271.1 hypothetical protein E3T21_17520 [Cryobacterium sp. TMB3-15]TFC73216.1 hypothetical protein E3T22_16535 [Cryobacterium sp. TMB3-10]TFC85358.1 hypothetical protein E3T19_17205 [Cryobacterium sp. TMT4-31]
MSENLLLARRTTPQQRDVPRMLTPPRRAEPRFDTPLPIQLPQPAVRPEFAVRNSPTDLVFRALWQLVGVYVFVVLLVKDRRLPR